ncbi:MAG: hypothetical protein U0228_09320 [Myxococcaceae bacterium]
MAPCLARASSVLLVPDDDAARAVTAELGDAFSAAKLTVKTAPPGSPAVTCLGDADRVGCLSTIGEKAKVVGVFVVSGGLKGSKGSLNLELIAGGKVIKKSTTKISKGKVKTQMKGPVAALIKLLPKGDAAPAPEPAKVTVSEAPKEPEPARVEPKTEPKVEPKPEPKPEPVAVNDTPKVEPKRDEPKLTPRARPDDDLDLRQPAPTAKKPKVAAWVVTGLTIAAAGTAATFAGLGMSAKGRLETVGADGTSALTYSEATALQQTANLDLTIALGTGIGAGVGAVVSGILWGVE